MSHLATIRTLLDESGVGGTALEELLVAHLHDLGLLERRASLDELDDVDLARIARVTRGHGAPLAGRRRWLLGLTQPRKDGMQNIRKKDFGGLVVTRGVGERVLIEIGDGRVVAVELDSIEGRQARLRVAAPKDCEILREELVRGDD